ncbi:aminotransferase class I/II-fold pyridoxal phosphate-dependent enzyme [Ideonella sp.]|uniref:aminotransferase class I/II-fold pyridoxal phosphate-dependent enzyme n=1 Tax=Ideonella sp. TaxID=1929293 RepID=UPI002B4732EF|nr:aminotransferase class I/II-fold pyridoxal phosphate-dependent enzyme [Ideonella sp.]HJV70103.1 aminotransferase class I/II-fold pyridoxal phosphate-dependent enzyme [Ideonella sp.]
MIDRLPRLHGGPDARGAAQWDFSTNANAAGPCPAALSALQRADATRYPDPGYQALRERLAAWHGVAPERIVPAASASEFIQRITAVGARIAPGPVQVPRHAYGDYGAAARAGGRAVLVDGDEHHGPAVSLRWYADPSSPLGQDAAPPAEPGACATVLDAVYAPLRLEGRSGWDGEARSAVFELHSPNKALGLPGVRAAYAIAPRASGAAGAWWRDALAAAEPSWPIGAHGVAMLEAWSDDSTQQWLAAQRETLRHWKGLLLALLDEVGAECRPSVTPFVCVRLPSGATPAALRVQGIRVRDAASFGLPGWVRLSVQPPAALAALREAIGALHHESTRKAHR